MSKPKAIGAALSLMMLTVILTGCTSGDNLGKIEKDLSNGGWIYFTNDTIDYPEAMGYLTFSSDGSLLIGDYISEEECIEYDDVSYWVQSEEVCYIDNNELAVGVTWRLDDEQTMSWMGSMTLDQETCGWVGQWDSYLQTCQVPMAVLIFELEGDNLVLLDEDGICLVGVRDLTDGSDQYEDIIPRIEAVELDICGDWDQDPGIE